MSKTFVFKRNRSEDVWRPVQHTPTVRRKSMSRERELSPARSPAKSHYHQSEFPLHASLAKGQSNQSFSPSSRRSSSMSPTRQRKHHDLKRKFIFQLHEEIKKPVQTTLLEEISDMNTITSICYDTLHDMMENKHQRKYLHHMNTSQNNSNTNRLHLDKTSNSRQVGTSSSVTEKKKKKLEEERLKKFGSASILAAPNYPKVGQTSKSTASEKSAADQAKKKQLIGGEQQKSPQGYDNNTKRQSSIRFTEEMNKFLAVADQKSNSTDSNKKEEFNKKEQMTPLQALYCPWLRLTKEQVEMLEKMCRDDGIDPGIHAHYDIDVSDVFADLKKPNAPGQPPPS